MNLIDADELLRKWDNMNRGRIEFDQVIMCEPVIDAEPVRHGHWEEIEIQLDWCEDDVDIMFKCSNCGEISPGKSSYCPFCGTKMDEEV